MNGRERERESERKNRIKFRKENKRFGEKTKELHLGSKTKESKTKTCFIHTHDCTMQLNAFSLIVPCVLCRVPVEIKSSGFE